MLGLEAPFVKGNTHFCWPVVRKVFPQTPHVRPLSLGLSGVAGDVVPMDDDVAGGRLMRNTRQTSTLSTFYLAMWSSQMCFASSLPCDPYNAEPKDVVRFAHSGHLRPLGVSNSCR